MKALTGKAFKSFKAYIKKENGLTNEDFSSHYNCQGYNKYTLADIIEWMDSVSIYVEVGLYPNEDGDIYFSGVIFGKLGGWDDLEYYTTRQQATEKAIEKAVEIYNKRGN